MPLSPERPSASQGVLAVQASLQQWRRGHPRATLREIEEAVDCHLAQVRTGLVEEVAHQEQEQTRPTCPTCGAAMQRVGVRERTVTTAQDAVLTLRGAGYRCPACGAGLFPPR